MKRSLIHYIFWKQSYQRDYSAKILKKKKQKQQADHSLALWKQEVIPYVYISGTMSFYSETFCCLQVLGSDASLCVQAAKILSEAWGTTHQRGEVGMAACPKSTLYKGRTSKRPAHIKSHRVFYIPPVPRVILPSTGSSSQPIYLPFLEGQLPPLLYSSQSPSPVPSQQEETLHNQKPTSRGQPELRT